MNPAVQRKPVRLSSHVKGYSNGSRGRRPDELITHIGLHARFGADELIGAEKETRPKESGCGDKGFL